MQVSEILHILIWEFLLLTMQTQPGITLWTEENCHLSTTYPNDSDETGIFDVTGELQSHCRWRISIPEQFDAIFISIEFTELSCEDGFLEFIDDNATACGICVEEDNLEFCHIYVKPDSCTEEEIWLKLVDEFGCNKAMIHTGFGDALMQIASLGNAAIYVDFSVEHLLYECEGTDNPKYNPNMGLGKPIPKNTITQDCKQFSENSAQTAAGISLITSPTPKVDRIVSASGTNVSTQLLELMAKPSTQPSPHENANKTTLATIHLATQQTLIETTDKYPTAKQLTTIISQLQEMTTTELLTEGHYNLTTFYDKTKPASTPITDEYQHSVKAMSAQEISGIAAKETEVRDPLTPQPDKGEAPTTYRTQDYQKSTDIPAGVSISQQVTTPIHRSPNQYTTAESGPIDVTQMQISTSAESRLSGANTNSTFPTHPEKSFSKATKAKIAGGVLAGLLLIVLIILIMWRLHKKTKKNAEKKKELEREKQECDTLV